MPEKHRILIVDDDASTRLAVVQALQKEAVIAMGAEADVLEASTAAAARQALQDEEFACVFLDHELADGTALDLLLEVRATGLITPVVILTGQRDAQAIAEVMSAGAADYLPKDRLHPDLIARSLRAALLFHQAQREKQVVLDELRARDRAIAAASNGIVIADPRLPDCPLIYTNAAFLTLTGYTEAEVIGHNCRFLQGPLTDQVVLDQLRDSIRQEQASQNLLLNYRKDGTVFWNEVTVTPVRDKRGVLTHFVGIQTDVTVRHEAQAARARLLFQEQARADREALLNRISQALRSLPDPEQILEAAVRELGQALKADRCYFSSYDQVADTALMGPEWHRSELPPLAGRYSMSAFAINRDLENNAGSTQVVADTKEDPALGKLGIRALLRVSVVSGASLTALAAVMMDGPRDWTAEEVLLLESVATQTQSALEAVWVQQRERRIAEHLQAALQPELPTGIAGLKLTRYYEAALEEAGVGGDFYDVFAVEKGRTALVLGDLSGKGLAAAAQVATVRNMLRAFLYSRPTVAEAITELNRVLAENNLLTGFSTLFVAAYDSGTREMKYVNCGQEPALLRRAGASSVTLLSSTGPVLGSIENEQFAEETLTLAPGDALAIFSDGLTEVGLSRTTMLGIEGVTALFEKSGEFEKSDDGLFGKSARQDKKTAAEVAEHIALRLIEGVDAAAQGGVVRDDVCLLVVVVEA